MLKGKTIVITGCLSGIGKETLRVVAENGADIVACALESTEEFETYCKNIADDYQIKVYPVYFNLMDNEAIKSAAKQINSLKLQIDGLINIAGINKDAYFGMITAKDMQDTFQVNLFSQILFSQYICKLMLRSKNSGSVAFVSSTSALDGNEGQTVYAASKAALIGAMQTMARELGKDGIRVNAVAPGVIRTPMTDRLSEENKATNIEKMDIKRLGEATEVANALVFLMSDSSSHITGQTIRIDGGMR